jgi:hypothetical protein
MIDAGHEVFVRRSSELEYLIPNLSAHGSLVGFSQVARSQA